MGIVVHGIAEVYHPGGVHTLAGWDTVATFDFGKNSWFTALLPDDDEARRWMTQRFYESPNPYASRLISWEAAHAVSEDIGFASTFVTPAELLVIAEKLACGEGEAPPWAAELPRAAFAFLSVLAPRHDNVRLLIYRS